MLKTKATVNCQNYISIFNNFKKIIVLLDLHANRVNNYALSYNACVVFRLGLISFVRFTLFVTSVQIIIILFD